MKNIGIDKIAHFGIGGLICAMITLVVMLQDGIIGWGAFLIPVIGDVVVFIASYLKEKMDNEFSWDDIWAAMLGCTVVHLGTFIGVLFNILSA